MKRTVSIVIPTYNAAGTLRQTLTAIMNQDYREINEVIVVDDGSIDETAAVVKSFDSVKYIYQDKSGPATARNRGFYESKGEIIFFTDTDCIPERNWISKSIVHFADESVGAVGGSYGIANPGRLLGGCVYKEILFRHNKMMPSFVRVFGSYNFGIRRSVFEEMGGFNTAYRYASGEDNDLSYRIIKAGHRIYFEKGSIVRHYHPVGVYGYLKHQFWHGFWRMKLYHDHPDMRKGDDYTFWKDIIEWPIALFVTLVAFAFAVIRGLPWVSNISLAPVLFFTAGTLFLIQLYYSARMLKGFREVWFYSFVMFLRSFFRGYGFVYGILGLPPYKRRQ